MTMVRKQVYLEKAQDEKLKMLSRKLNVTEAELIRRGIDQLPVEGDEERTRREAGERLIALLEKLAARAPRSEGGRSWSRDELYDERPGYLSGR